MLMKKMFLAAATASLLFTGVAMAGADKAAADKAIAAAESAIKASKAVDGEWRDAGKMVKAAKAAAKAGKFDDAVKSANAAEAQGHLGTAQAKAESGTGNPSYLYN